MSEVSVYGVIYGIAVVGEPYRYVGFTTKKPNTRFSEHLNRARRIPLPHYGVARWLSSHLDDAVVMDVLEDCRTAEELYAAEKWWIKHLRTHISEGGFNHTWGGDGVPSAVSRAKQTRARTGVKLSAETRQKMSERRKGIAPMWATEAVAKKRHQKHLDEQQLYPNCKQCIKLSAEKDNSK